MWFWSYQFIAASLSFPDDPLVRSYNRKDMFTGSTILLFLSSLHFTIAQECKYVRYETMAEAERRAVFERCLLNCNESSRDPNPCHTCAIPYKGYGCLLKREELVGCETDCASQNDEQRFKRCLHRCAHKRRTLKKLREFKRVQEWRITHFL